MSIAAEACAKLGEGKRLAGFQVLKALDGLLENSQVDMFPLQSVIVFQAIGADKGSAALSVPGYELLPLPAPQLFTQQFSERGSGP